MSADLRGVSIDRIVLRGVDLGPAELLELRVALRRALSDEPAAPGTATPDDPVSRAPDALASHLAARVLSASRGQR